MSPTTGITTTALMPADEATREIAEELYGEIAAAPIISPHGHVDPRMLLDDEPFPDPAKLLIRHDHYITRLLFASGVPLAELGLDATAPQDARSVWRLLAAHWHRFAGTASGYWLQYEFSALFGIRDELSESTADEIYDRIAAILAEPDFRPRALFDRFGIELLATTDDPLDDLSAHRAIAAGGVVAGRVIPTFRPDAYLDPSTAGFADRIQALHDATGRSGTFEGYLRALEDRREHFIARGAVSADHGVLEPFTVDLSGERRGAALSRRSGRAPRCRRAAAVPRTHALPDGTDERG